MSNETMTAGRLGTFDDILYTRPDMHLLESDFDTLLERFRNAATYEEQDNALERINRLRSTFETASSVSSVRHTIDTRDAFYEGENDFFDHNGPVYEGLINRFYKELVSAKFKSQLEAKYGKLLFIKATLAMETFKPEIIEDLQKENELSSKYTKLLSSAKIQFEGEELNLSGLTPYEQSADRSIRKKAMEAKYGFLADNSAELDSIFDELVKVRAGIAKKLGYKSYIEYSYARLQRTEYDKEMVAFYRSQILQHVVPVSQKLRKRQAKRLGLDSLKFYDEALEFQSGNAKPKGDPAWIIDKGSRMYEELSAETREFFHFMTGHGLMDLETKPGKAPGGYCTFINDYKAPFIYSNFNGTSGDIDVLTHEAGHAFQVYMSRNFAVPEYHWPTYEACEIHSMSMEFFTWPWMESFFEEETDKYKFAHLGSSINFLPYGATVDEFQHFVYENPAATPAERNAAWRSIEQKYLPQRDYSGNAYLESGAFWQKQTHIYNTPFYYIDYTLAQVCAFQFWVRANENREKAWADYVTLCKAGGSKPFLELVKLAGLESPFDAGCVEKVVKKIENWLDAVDDSKLV
jgi:M3 family oligoendopeptidase